MPLSNNSKHDLRIKNLLKIQKLTEVKSNLKVKYVNPKIKKKYI